MLRDRSRAAPQDGRQPVPPQSVGVVDLAVDDEYGEGTPLARAMGRAFQRLSAYPSSKVTTTRCLRDGLQMASRIEASATHKSSSTCAEKLSNPTQRPKGSSTLWATR